MEGHRLQPCRKGIDNFVRLLAAEVSVRISSKRSFPQRPKPEVLVPVLTAQLKPMPFPTTHPGRARSENKTMFDFLKHILSGQNQFASGGLLLMIVGGLGVYLRAVPMGLWAWIV